MNNIKVIEIGGNLMWAIILAALFISLGMDCFGG
jgi:hypothetical protein